jgi:hypothetical protein
MCSTNWNESKISDQQMSKHQCLPRYRWCSCHLHNRCSLWFPCLTTQLSSPRLREVHIFKKFLILLRPPEGHSLLFALIFPTHWPALNIQRSLGGCTGKAHRIKVRRSCRPVDWTSMPCSLSIESLSQVLFGNAGKMSCCSIIRESHVLSFLKRHTFQDYWYII